MLLYELHSSHISLTKLQLTYRFHQIFTHLLWIRLHGSVHKIIKKSVQIQLLKSCLKFRINLFSYWSLVRPFLHLFVHLMREIFALCFHLSLIFSVFFALFHGSNYRNNNEYMAYFSNVCHSQISFKDFWECYKLLSLFWNDLY